MTRYRIAGLVAEVDLEIDQLLNVRGVEQFRIGRVSPDVCLSLYIVDPASLALPPLTPVETETLSRLFFCANGNWDSPLLRLTEVRKRLDAHRTEADWVSVQSLETAFTILDFARCVREEFLLLDRSMDVPNWYRPPNLLAPFLPSFGAAILHAAGIVREGKAALFLAPDGGGKSTVAAHPGAGLVLGDDQIVVREEGDGFHAYGTPWGKMVDSLHHAGLGAFFLLEQAEEFALNPLKTRELLEYLWMEHPHHHYALPRHLRPQAFNLLVDACQQVPAYRMRFGKYCIDWRAIDQAMAG
jgi:hypothetical protein